MENELKRVLQQLFEKHKDPIMEFNGTCHDCSKEISVVVEMEDDGRTTMIGGYLYTPKGMDKKFLKCETCHDKDSVLRNYQECEVFSRVVGYLRPVKQWNKGKQEEFKERVNFNVKGIKSG